MTDQTPANFRAMAELAARNYVLRLVEDSRVDGDSETLDGYPTLEAEHVNHAFHELLEEAAKVTAGFPPDRQMPVVREDGRVWYCHTTETTDLETLNAALVALAAEYAWLAHYRAQRIEEFAALLSLRSLRGMLESGES